MTPVKMFTFLSHSVNMTDNTSVCYVGPHFPLFIDRDNSVHLICTLTSALPFG